LLRLDQSILKGVAFSLIRASLKKSHADSFSI
jgi:hypothetical protein